MPSIDQQLFLWINATADTPAILIFIARWFSEVLPKLALFALFPLVFVGPQARRQVLGAALAMLLAWAAVRGLRGLFEMPRPFALGLGHQWLAHASTPSFPSFHAALSAAWAAGLWLWTERRSLAWGLATGAVALVIAWSRVFLGLHFVSDVLAGLALGVSCALLARLFMLRVKWTLRSVKPSSAGSEIR